MADKKTDVAGKDGAAEAVAEKPVDKVEAEASTEPEKASSGTGSRKPKKQQNEDLSGHPQFRAMQSAYDSKIAAMQKQLEELQTRDMTDAEKERYFTSRKGQELLEQQQQLARERAEIQRFRDLQSLSSETGVPFDVLEEARSPIEAARIATQWMRDNLTKQEQAAVKAKQEKAERNSVDLGGGTARKPEDDLMAAYEDARKRGDSAALWATMRKMG